MRECPNCHSRIRYSAFIYLGRYWDKIRCSTCRSELKLRGPFAWGTELIGLVVCVGIYGAIKGNWLHLVLTLPVSFVVLWLQYRLVRLEAVKAPAH
jgi:hypothetical protein